MNEQATQTRGTARLGGWPAAVGATRNEASARVTHGPFMPSRRRRHTAALFLLSWVAAVGCHAERLERQRTQLDAMRTDTLPFSRVASVPLRRRAALSDSLFGNPVLLERVGRYAVVADLSSRWPLQLISLPALQRVLEFSRHGNGPGEVTSVVSFVGGRLFGAASDPDSLAISVFDPNERRLTGFRIGLRGTPVVTATATQGLSTGAMLTDVLQAADGTIIGVGLLDSARFARFDASGTARGVAGEAPSGNPGITNHVWSHVFQSRLARDSLSGHIFVAHRHAGSFEIFDATLARLAERDGPLPFRPVFQVEQGARGPIMATGDDLRFGYTSVCAGRGLFFALFSGRTRATDPGEATEGRFVHVFDAEGKFLRAYALDVAASAITLDAEQGQLLATTSSPRPGLAVFVLPAGWDRAAEP